MTIGIHQPYLFPYLGYWQLMNYVDKYVISDSLQHIKRGFINRNNILIKGQRHMFTLEVLGVHLHTRINEVEVGGNAKKIVKSIFHAYCHAPYFKDVFPMIEEILLNDEKNLARYLGNSIIRVARYLDMETEFIYESGLPERHDLKAQSLIIDTCKRLHADRYINAIGGRKLYDKEAFLKEGIELNFLKMDDIVYKQFNHEFIPNLSIIDVMMFNSKDEVKALLTKFSFV